MDVESWFAVAPAAAPLTTVESKLPEPMLTEESRLNDVAVIAPLIVAPVAVIAPVVETVKLPPPISNDPASMAPRLELIAAKFVVLMFSAMMVVAVISTTERCLTNKLVVVPELLQLRILMATFSYPSAAWIIVASVSGTSLMFTFEPIR